MGSEITWASHLILGDDCWLLRVWPLQIKSGRKVINLYSYSVKKKESTESSIYSTPFLLVQHPRRTDKERLPQKVIIIKSPQILLVSHRHHRRRVTFVVQILLHLLFFLLALPYIRTCVCTTLPISPFAQYPTLGRGG